MEPHGLFVAPWQGVGTVIEVVAAVLATMIVLACWRLDRLRRRSSR